MQLVPFLSRALSSGWSESPPARMESKSVHQAPHSIAQPSKGQQTAQNSKPSQNSQPLHVPNNANATKNACNPSAEPFNITVSNTTLHNSTINISPVLNVSCRCSFPACSAFLPAPSVYRGTDSVQESAHSAPKPAPSATTHSTAAGQRAPGRPMSPRLPEPSRVNVQQSASATQAKSQTVPNRQTQSQVVYPYPHGYPRMSAETAEERKRKLLEEKEKRRELEWEEYLQEVRRIADKADNPMKVLLFPPKFQPGKRLRCEGGSGYSTNYSYSSSDNSSDDSGPFWERGWKNYSDSDYSDDGSPLSPSAWNSANKRQSATPIFIPINAFNKPTPQKQATDAAVTGANQKPTADEKEKEKEKETKSDQDQATQRPYALRSKSSQSTKDSK